MIQTGCKHVLIWIAIEPVRRKTILGIHLSEERNMFVAENYFIRSLVSSMVTMQYIHRLGKGLHGILNKPVLFYIENIDYITTGKKRN